MDIRITKSIENNLLKVFLKISGPAISRINNILDIGKKWNIYTQADFVKPPG
jgi:hypothetical protein